MRMARQGQTRPDKARQGQMPMPPVLPRAAGVALLSTQQIPCCMCGSVCCLAPQFPGPPGRTAPVGRCKEKQIMALVQTLKRYPLLTYFVLTYVLTWACWSPVAITKTWATFPFVVFAALG